VYVGLDFGIHRDVSFGIEDSFRSYNQNYTGSKYNSSITGLLGNVNYHFNRIMEIPSNWDLYAGLNLGTTSGPLLQTIPEPVLQVFVWVLR
jgi:outer membrane immunogenic protein